MAKSDCTPDRPKQVILVYANGTMVINLNEQYAGGKIDAIWFDLKGANPDGKKCDNPKPGKYISNNVTTSEEEAPPGCCYVDGQLVCW